jgi:hypothetical protein
MARRVFFSFHYEADIWRASQVRNSWVTYGHGAAAGFWDAASWEGIKKQGEAAIHKWIDQQLIGVSVTVVLIGSETAERKYVQYEIKRSYEEGKGLLGVYIHRMKNQAGYATTKGNNPLDLFYVSEGEGELFFSQMYSTFDWVADDGYANLADWIEQAAVDAGR